MVSCEYLVEALKAALHAPSGAGDPLDPSATHAGFFAALDDDLHTPVALGQIEVLASDILTAAEAGRSVVAAQAALREMANVFGFWAAA